MEPETEMQGKTELEQRINITEENQYEELGQNQKIETLLDGKDSQASSTLSPSGKNDDHHNESEQPVNNTSKECQQLEETIEIVNSIQVQGTNELEQLKDKQINNIKEKQCQELGQNEKIKRLINVHDDDHNESEQPINSMSKEHQQFEENTEICTSIQVQLQRNNEHEESIMDTEEKCADQEPPLWNWVWPYELSSVEPLSCVAKTSNNEYDKCLKGCKWAPDGSCLLTNSEDKKLRLFNIPTELSTGGTDWQTLDYKNEEWCSVFGVKEGGQVYDYCWFPRMSSMDPDTSCFLTSAQDNPIHLWDAYDGQLRATYLAYNYADVIIAAHSIAFDASGTKIFCGYHKVIRIFDVSRPGRQCVERKLTGKLLPDLNVGGIVSCIAVHPTSDTLYACGSYNKSIGIYLDDGTVVCVLVGHFGGLTHLKFNSDGTKLYSGSRKDSRLFCWDMRNLSTEYQIFDRVVDTSQRIYFDLTPNEKYLVSGCTNGVVRVWDLHSAISESQDNAESDIPTSPHYELTASTDCINGISCNPYLPLLATASGQRYFPDIAMDEADDIFVDSSSSQENTVRLFKFV